MGRPLNKKYFGNRNIGTGGDTPAVGGNYGGDDGIGGQGIASVTISGVWAGYTTATTTVVFGSPDLPGGVQATGTVTVTGDVPTLVTITEKGSGYTSVPTVTIADSDGGAETTGTAVAVLTTDSGGFLGSGNNVGGNVNAATQQDNAITIYANTANAGAKIGDIRKQKGSRRYQVRTADGIAICKLVADDTPAVGEAYITATDQGGATYWVTKLTSHRATIVPKGVGSPQFPLVNGDPQHVGWTFGTAIAPSTGVLGKVRIQNA